MARLSKFLPWASFRREFEMARIFRTIEEEFIHGAGMKTHLMNALQLW